MKTGSYTDLKKYGLILDYFGIFENLNQALNFDKTELGEVAFPFTQLRGMFVEQIDALLQMFDGIARDGAHATLMQALLRLNDDDKARRDFEKRYHDVRVLYETLSPDEALRPHIDDYTWLTKLHLLYRKKFYPREHWEIGKEDGASTRSLIREHVDVRELDADFPTYSLDENYLTKIEVQDPNAKALDIEAMLDAEIRIRLDEDEDVRPLSERLNRIIEQKRAGTLAGIKLLKELEELTRQVVDVVQEAQRPVQDSIAKEVRGRLPNVDEAKALEVTQEIVAIVFNSIFTTQAQRQRPASSSVRVICVCKREF